MLARTLHVYDRPVVAPVTVIGDTDPDPVRATPPFDDAHDTPNEVTAVPPADAGAVKETTSGPVAVVVEPDFATTAVGAPGTVAGTTAADGDDAGP